MPARDDGKNPRTSRGHRSAIKVRTMDNVSRPPSGPSPEPFAFLDAALTYAQKHGWAVLPIHTPRGGQCSCGNPTCTSVGKHPRTPHGVKDATTDEATIRDWWTRWPDANIGIATGADSGLV